MGSYKEEKREGRMTIGKRTLIALPRWALYTILAGVVLDLGISGALAYQDVQIRSDTQAAHCWFKVLDKAVLIKPSPAKTVELNKEAHSCVKYIP